MYARLQFQPWGADKGGLNAVAVKEASELAAPVTVIFDAVFHGGTWWMARCRERVALRVEGLNY